MANGLETGGSFFDAVEETLPRAARFTDAMSFLQSAPSFSPHHLLDNLGWDGKNCPSLMIDVGGSRGCIAIEILRKYPGIRYIVQDLKEVVESAETPNDLADRLKFQEHNFFSDQTVLGADVYFLRSILRDWSDTYAIKIVRSLIPALRHGSRIILNEVCLPEPGVVSFYQEQVLR